MMGDQPQDTKALERELATRLAHLTPAEQEAVLAEALDLLTVKEQAAVLAPLIAALGLNGHGAGSGHKPLGQRERRDA